MPPCVLQVTETDEYLKPYLPQLKTRFRKCLLAGSSARLRGGGERPPRHLGLRSLFLCACLWLASPPVGTERFITALRNIDEHGGGLNDFSQSYQKYGFNRATVGDKSGIRYVEWAPNATEAYLVGDFNFWNTSANRMNRDEYVRMGTRDGEGMVVGRRRYGRRVIVT